MRAAFQHNPLDTRLNPGQNPTSTVGPWARVLGWCAGRDSRAEGWMVQGCGPLWFWSLWGSHACSKKSTVPQALPAAPGQPCREQVLALVPPAEALPAVNHPPWLTAQPSTLPCGAGRGLLRLWAGDAWAASISFCPPIHLSTLRRLPCYFSLYSTELH